MEERLEILVRSLLYRKVRSLLEVQFISLHINLFRLAVLMFSLFDHSRNNIAYLKPYKKWYMNSMDVLLLLYFSVICRLLDLSCFTAEPTQFCIILIIPTIIYTVLYQKSWSVANSFGVETCHSLLSLIFSESNQLLVNILNCPSYQTQCEL